MFPEEVGLNKILVKRAEMALMELQRRAYISVLEQQETDRAACWYLKKRPLWPPEACMEIYWPSEDGGGGTLPPHELLQQQGGQRGAVMAALTAWLTRRRKCRPLRSPSWVFLKQRIFTVLPPPPSTSLFITPAFPLHYPDFNYIWLFISLPCLFIDLNTISHLISCNCWAPEALISQDC